MFYAFVRNVNFMFGVLACICSIPCILLAVNQLKYGDDLSQFDNNDYANLQSPQSSPNYNTTGSSYASRLSVGTVFRNPYNATYKILFSMDKSSNLFRADLIVYLNILGVVYMLFHSIFLRRLLVGLSHEIDKKEISPSDFAIVVRNIPKGYTKDSLKVQIEKNFND